MGQKALILRTCLADGTSYGGFRWPESGPVEAPDWDPVPECGHGLHGLVWGEGAGFLLHWNADALWQIVEVDCDTIVDLGGKVKFPRGNVLHTGSRESATQLLFSNGGAGKRIVGLTLTGGYRSTLAGGDRSTLTGGDRSTLAGGNGSTLTGGDWCTLTGGDRSTLAGGNGSTLTGGEWSTLIGGDRSTLTGGNECTLTGGEWSTLTGGNGSTLTGGDWSTLTGGNGSTLTGGDWSTLTGGNGSTLTGGKKAELRIRYWDPSAQRMRTVIAYVGENGIKPHVAYRLNEKRKFVAARKKS